MPSDKPILTIRVPHEFHKQFKEIAADKDLSVSWLGYHVLKKSMADQGLITSVIPNLDNRQNTVRAS